MPDLFDFAQVNSQKEPLAARMRPRTLDEYIGQEAIVGKGRLLRRAIETDFVSSLIFYGPPGVGKTTLAMIIANTTKSYFKSLSAVTSGVADLRTVMNEAAENLRIYGKRTLLFIDEIHRFNKSQQDALLPSVENGTVILIGATTENPYFEVNRALLSRSRIFRLEALSAENIVILLQRALEDRDRGLGEKNIVCDEGVLEFWAEMSSGDARTAYNALELAVLSTAAENGVIHITMDIARESIQKKVLAYDKHGDWHYDVASAFIKSMRGSDPDAALHWLARMIEAGESPEFIARRVVICAAEDVGLADPQALVVAQAAADAARFVGFPEAQLILAEAVLYIATAPKSNSATLAIFAAEADLRDKPFSGVPIHLRDAHYSGSKDLGHIGYKYAHDYENHYVEQQYLPDELQGRVYYQPQDNEREQKINNHMRKIKNKGY